MKNASEILQKCLFFVFKPALEYIQRILLPNQLLQENCQHFRSSGVLLRGSNFMNSLKHVMYNTYLVYLVKKRNACTQTRHKLINL
jgi:hypothetical protein